jgi:hypothetical protein
MAKFTQPTTLTLELTRDERDVLRVGLNHTIMYGTSGEEDRARLLLADLSAGDE